MKSTYQCNVTEQTINMVWLLDITLHCNTLPLTQHHSLLHNAA